MIGIMTGTYGFTQTFVRIPLGMTTDLTSGYHTVILLFDLCEISMVYHILQISCRCSSFDLVGFFGIVCGIL